MSFSVDLWNGFDYIKTAFSLNNKRVKQIVDILTSYSNIEKEYYKGLDNLYKETKESKDFQKSNSLLDDTIYLLICSLKTESDKHKTFYNNINKNIIEVKEKLDKIKLQITPYFTENIQNKDVFNRYLNNLVLKQDAYNKSCKELCYCIAENAVHKIMEEKVHNKENKNDKNDKNKNDKIKEQIKEKMNYKEFVNKNFMYYFNNNILKDIINKKENIIKKLIDNKNEYVKCISETDKEREKYNKITEDILNELQKQYKSLIFLFQNLIHNYVKEKINTLNEIIELNNNNDKEKYSKLHYKKQTLSFITHNATKEFPMNKLEFIPYKINKNKIVQKLSKYNELSADDQNKIFDEVKNILNKSKINTYENEYLSQNVTNRNICGRIRRIQNVNKFRRSGSSDMLNIKNIGNNNILNNFNKGDKKLNENINKKIELSKSKNNNININTIKLITNQNKDDIMIDKEIERKKNFNFIKDFVYKLVISKEDIQKDILSEIYSDNSSDENEYEKKEIKNKNEDEKKNKESYMYNELLFGFMDLIAISNKDHNEYLDFFITILGFHRSKGYFLLNENTYKIFINIFNYILVNYKTSNNVIKNIILFSQTFYRIDNSNNKIYILNGLKNHTAFNNAETWHRAINYNLSLSIKNNNSYSLNIENKEEYLKSLNKIILNTIISYLYDLKLSTTEEKVYKEVKNFYISVYNLDGKSIEEQIKKLCGETNDKNDDENEKTEDENKSISILTCDDKNSFRDEKNTLNFSDKKDGEDENKDENIINSDDKKNNKDENSVKGEK